MANRVLDILEQNGYNTNGNKMIDPVFGGQNGRSPSLGYDDNGTLKSQWISNQGHVSRNIVAVVLQAPEFFNYMQSPEKWVETLKSLWELHAESIEGLNGSLTVETAEHPIGGAGEQQEEVTNVTRERTTLSLTTKDKMGKPFQTFLDMWIRWGIMDPDTKDPLVSTLRDIDLGLYTANNYSATILFFEPDITNKWPVEAWLCANVFPKSKGELTGKKAITEGGELVELSIEWSSITVSDNSVKALAQSIMNDMSVFSQLPTNQPLFVDGRESNISDEDVPMGYNRVQQ